MLEIAAFGIAIVVVYGSYKYVLDWLRYKLPPGPMPLPLIGNLGVLAVDPVKVKPWRALRDVAAKYGAVSTIYLGQNRMIVLHGVEMIQEALVKQSKVFSWRGEKDLAGYEDIPVGVVSANYDEWVRRRRFGIKAMRDFGMGKEAMAVKISEEIGPLVDELKKQNGQAFSIRPLLNTAVSNVICSIVFGKRFDFDDEKFRQILASIEKTTKMEPVNVLYLIIPFLKYFSKAPAATNIIAVHELVAKMVDESIRAHRTDFDPDNIRDFPDLFIANEMSEDGLRIDEFAKVMTDMFSAGTETTSTALTWTILYLATFEKVQQKAHDAIDQVIQSDRLPTLEDRPKLVYLDAIFHEILRHVTIAPMALNHSNRLQQTTLAGYDIPPYTLVMYNMMAVHRDPNYWKDADVFDPERWIDPETGKLISHGSHFLPFGIGPRICLGEALARMEYFLFLTSMLHRYKFRLEEPVDLESGLQGPVHVPPSFKVVAELRI